VTDPAGNTVSLIEYTANEASQLDGLVHREGVFGARFVGDGWGSFGANGYGGQDVITIRATQSGAMIGCPVDYPSPAASISFQPRQVEVSVASVQGSDPGPKPTSITLLDDMACIASKCDALDFNNDGVFPDVQDITDFVLVFGAGACPTACCNDLDFNNDGVFPDNADVFDFVGVFGGSGC
jgi:hypothetical protein